MFKKGYKQTEEHRYKIGQTKIGNKYNLGRHHTKETKMKISQSKLGRKRPIEEKKRISETMKIKFASGELVPWSKGLTKETNLSLRNLSESLIGKNVGDNNPARRPEVREKIRDSKLGKSNILIRGSNNGNWNGGTMFEPYTSEFNGNLKQRIKERDNHTCQLCGVPECECLRKLSVHHIDYNKINCLPNNLISLCNSCNTKVNTKRDNWIKYFNDIIIPRVQKDTYSRALYREILRVMG